MTDYVVIASLARANIPALQKDKILLGNLVNFSRNFSNIEFSDNRGIELAVIYLWHL